jgi:hypothetical protein
MTRHLARIHTAVVLAASVAVGAPADVTVQTKLPVIDVTVQYTGKAQVTDTTPIWVYLFNTTNPNAATPPIAFKRLAKNGGAVQFEYGGTEQVYVFVALDTKGGYDPSAGAPPAGTPFGSYSTVGNTAAAVKLTPVTKITITFNDSVVFTP